MMDNKSIDKLYNVLKDDSEKRDGKLNNNEKHNDESENVVSPRPPPKELNLENFNCNEFEAFEKVEEILYEETNEKLILAGCLIFELLNNVDFGANPDDVDEGYEKIRVLYNWLIDIKHGLDSMVIARSNWGC